MPALIIGSPNPVASWCEVERELGLVTQEVGDGSHGLGADEVDARLDHRIAETGSVLVVGPAPDRDFAGNPAHRLQDREGERTVE